MPVILCDSVLSSVIVEFVSAKELPKKGWELILRYGPENPWVSGTWRAPRGHSHQPPSPTHTALPAGGCPHLTPSLSRRAHSVLILMLPNPLWTVSSFLKHISRAWSSCPWQWQWLSTRDLALHASSWSSHGMSRQWAQGLVKALSVSVFLAWKKALLGKNPLICGMHQCSHSRVCPEQNPVSV